MLKIFFKKTLTLVSVGALSVGLMMTASTVANADNTPVVNISELSNISISVWENSMTHQAYDWVFSPDRKKLAVIYPTLDRITIYDVGTNGSITGGVNTYIGAWALSPQFSPDGKFMAYRVNGGSYVKVLKVNSDNTLSNEVLNQTGGPVANFSFSHDGSSVVVRTNEYGWGYLYTYQVDSNGVFSGEVKSSAMQNNTSSLTFSPNGKFLFQTDYYGVITKWDIESDGSLSNRIDYQNGTFQNGKMLISPDGNLLTVVASSNNVATFHVNSDGSLSDRVDTQVSSSSNYNPSSLAFSSDGSVLAVGGSTNVMSLFRVNSDGILDGKVDISVGHKPSAIGFSSDDSSLIALGSNKATMFSVKPYKAPPIAGTVGQVNTTVESSISLIIDDVDDSVLLKDIPGVENVTDTDNQMSYLVKSNNLEGYNVTIQADQEKLLPRDTNTNLDSIPVNLLMIEQPDTATKGTSSGTQTLSHTASKLLYSQNERSVENGDSFTSLFALTEMPFVNADDYSGTVTYTATAN